MKFDFEMRLIGYYNKPKQDMKPEEEKIGDAQTLAELLGKTFKKLAFSANNDSVFLSILKGNTVFILKDKDGYLYAYYPYKQIARLTNVKYVKGDVNPIPLKYKDWFIPGRELSLRNKRKYTISKSGRDILIIRGNRVLPLDWSEDKTLTFADLYKVLDDPWVTLIEETLDCGDCDGYDYSKCDKFECDLDCEFCKRNPRRRNICNDSCFYHRYNTAVYISINTSIVENDLKPYRKFMSDVMQPHSLLANEVLWSDKYSSWLQEMTDRCSFLSFYRHEQCLDDFIKQVEHCNKLQNARFTSKGKKIEIKVKGEAIYKVLVSDIKIKKHGFLFWKDWHFESDGKVYEFYSDSFVLFDFLLTSYNCELEEFANNKQNCTVSLERIEDDKKYKVLDVQYK